MDVQYRNLEQTEHYWRRVVRQSYNVPVNALLGWHFLNSDKRLLHGDGREVVVGETLSLPHREKHANFPIVGNWGFHAGYTVRQAFVNVPYNNSADWLCLVWVRGKTQRALTLFCGAQRHCLAMLEFTPELIGLTNDYNFLRQAITRISQASPDKFHTPPLVDNMFHLMILSQMGLNIQLTKER